MQVYIAIKVPRGDRELEQLSALQELAGTLYTALQRI